MKKIFSIALLINSLITAGQNNLNLVPMPAEVRMGKGEFIFKQPIGFIVNDWFDIGNGGVDRFQKYLKKNFGFTKLINGDTHSYGLPSEIFLSIDKERKDDGYSLEVRKKDIVIEGNAKGIFYAFETLKQLIRKNNKNQVTIPQCKIVDSSRFQYRGMHLDVARHFYPVSFIKKYIDYLSAYKFNTFHWHLTEDQGWRIEIKKYPKLTQVGGYRNGTIMGRYPGKGNDNIRYGGFYTQAQIKDIVQYAADRYITIIPEIEMPGHASAAIAAYPQLSCFPDEDTKVPEDCAWNGTRKGKQVQQTWGVFEDVFAPTEYTFNFLQDVLDEVMALFPGKYIHIGGDECPKESWKRSAFCQQLIKEKNIKDEHGLQSYFIGRIEKYLNSKGRNIIGWDEILEGGLAPNATVMSWRGEEGGVEAAKQDHDVIMTPGKPVYFDHSQSKNEDSITIGGYNSLEAVYDYEPIPAALNTKQAKHVLGAQANMWTEYMKNTRKVEYMLFPRIIALSEVLWSPKEKRNWKDFEERLPVIFDRLEKEKVNYSRAYYDLTATVLQAPDMSGVLWKIESKQPKNTITINKNNSDSIWGYQKPQLITESGTMYAYNDKTRLIQNFSFNKATGKKITLTTQVSKNYPGDGAFTLVNGVQNTKGLAKSSEFLGFSGTDLDATIDFGKDVEISKINLHTLHQNGSWIYLPKEIEVSFIPYIDTTIITRHPPIESITQKVTDENNVQVIKLPEAKTCRYLRVVVKNYGIIPSGKPGAGNPAWLFVDEIEVE